MKMSMKRVIAMLALVLLLVGLFPAIPIEVNAANDFYGDYTDVSKIPDYGSCPSMQGLAVGSQKLYSVKINSTNTSAVIYMTDKDSGSSVKLYNKDNSSYYFTNLGHANDMDVWGIDGYSHLFVINDSKIIRLKRDGNNLSQYGTYTLTYNGSTMEASAIAIKSVSNGVITFITKLSMNLYTGTISTTATSGEIALTKLCSISKAKVYIKGEYLDLSSFVNQGMGYHNGNLYVPITGDDNWLNRSVIMVFNLDDAKGTILPSEAIVFRVTSGAYSALFEIESCDISSGDGKLYFSTNRRVTNSDTNHDGVSSFDTYTFVKLTEPATNQIFTLRYNANGGTGSMEDTVVKHGISTKIATNTFTRYTYKFTGWTAYRSKQDLWYYTNGSSTGWYAEGSQPSGYTKYVYKDGVSVSATASVPDDVVMMYAQWDAPSTYTVRYDANGGTGTMADTQVTYGVNTNLSTNTFTREGYTFAGWHAYRTIEDQWYYTNGTDSGWYAEGSQPSGYTKSVYRDGVAVAKTTGHDGDVAIFYAQWTPNDYTVTFKDADGTVLSSGVYSAGSTVTPPAAPSKAFDSTYHYTFAGWDNTVAEVTGDATYTATYTATAHSYSVKENQASCTVNGSRVYSCACGYSCSETITAPGHSYHAVVTAPTCTEKGYTTYTCDCGDSYVDDEVAALGHSYDEGKVTTEPTCEDTGVKTFTCGT